MHCVLNCAQVFPYCGTHGVGSRVLLPLPPLSSSSKRQHGRPRGPKSVRPFFAPLPASGCARDVPSLTRMASETAPFARRRLRSSLCAVGDHGLGVWALMEAKASGLHPGQAGERLLKQRPKVLRQADYDGLVKAGAADCVSVFIAAVPVELRRATCSLGTVTLNYGYMVQTQLFQVVGSPFGTLIESVDHDPSASFGHRPRGFLCSARVLDVRLEACLSFQCLLRSTLDTHCPQGVSE